MSWINDAVVETVTEKEVKQVEAYRQQLKSKRTQDLNELVHTFPDGRIMQVRPQDLGNIRTAITNNIEQKWIMEDNTTRLVTVEELVLAMGDGIEHGQIIWTEYANALDQLYGGV